MGQRLWRLRLLLKRIADDAIAEATSDASAVVPGPGGSMPSVRQDPDIVTVATEACFRNGIRFGGVAAVTLFM